MELRGEPGMGLSGVKSVMLGASTDEDASPPELRALVEMERSGLAWNVVDVVGGTAPAATSSEDDAAGSPSGEGAPAGAPPLSSSTVAASVVTSRTLVRERPRAESIKFAADKE